MVSGQRRYLESDQYLGCETEALAVGDRSYRHVYTVSRTEGEASPAVLERSPSQRLRPSRAVIFRRRALLAAVAVAMLVMLALPWGGTGGRSLATPGAARAGSLVAGTTYVVRRGDTLWGIAERLAGNGDPRPVVAQLEVQAGGDALQPGEVLHLP